MKKQLIIKSIVVMLIFNLIGMLTFTINIEKVNAATTTIVNPYNNQLAVNAKADQIIQTAKYLIGKATYATSTSEISTTYPYKFRCASFMNFIFKSNGVDLATTDENNMIQQGYYVPKDQLQKGDLVFFDSTPKDGDPTNHVGLYIGDNKIIHMANTKLNVVISDLNSKSYYRNYYVGARRVLPSLLSANPATKGDKIVSTAFDLKDKVTISSRTNNIASMTFTNGGLINYIFMKNGINLGTTNIREQMKLGKAVSKRNLQKGDLVFFNYSVGSTTPGMVGIYAGDHRLILFTPSNGFYTRVDLLNWYKQHYITARRVL
jgi:Cell wall-associated hydrolases (invasion-associated proteins)